MVSCLDGSYATRRFSDSVELAVDMNSSGCEALSAANTASVGTKIVDPDEGGTLRRMLYTKDVLLAGVPRYSRTVRARTETAASKGTIAIFIVGVEVRV